MTRDPSTLSVLLGLPTIVFLVVVCAFADQHTPLRRFSRWLIHDAGRWGE